MGNVKCMKKYVPKMAKLLHYGKAKKYAGGSRRDGKEAVYSDGNRWKGLSILRFFILVPGRRWSRKVESLT